MTEQERSINLQELKVVVDAAWQVIFSSLATELPPDKEAEDFAQTLEKAVQRGKNKAKETGADLNAITVELQGTELEVWQLLSLRFQSLVKKKPTS